MRVIILTRMVRENLWLSPARENLTQAIFGGEGLCLLRGGATNPWFCFMRVMILKRMVYFFPSDKAILVIFFFPYNPHPDKPPPPVPPQKAWFRSISAPFRSVSRPFQLRLAPFRVCFGSVSGPFRGVGWGQGEGLPLRIFWGHFLEITSRGKKKTSRNKNNLAGLIVMLVLKGIFGGSVKITSANKNNFWGKNSLKRFLGSV